MMRHCVKGELRFPKMPDDTAPAGQPQFQPSGLRSPNWTGTRLDENRRPSYDW